MPRGIRGRLQRGRGGRRRPAAAAAVQCGAEEGVRDRHGGRRKGQLRSTELMPIANVSISDLPDPWIKKVVMIFSI